MARKPSAKNLKLKANKEASKAIKIAEKTLEQISYIERFKNIKVSKKWAAIGIILGLLILAYLNKGLFLAATVNGSPITSIELSQRLHKMYKLSVLNQMIDEKIIQQEAAKRNVTVSQAEINDRLNQMQQAYGGEAVFNSLLAQQGLERAVFIRSNVYLPLLVEKMYKEQIQPTDDEIKKFMEDNKNTPEATDEAKFKVMAENSVKQEKLVKIFQEKFQELKSQAKVQIF